ncbi:hypothetical protein DFH06DRAFT_1321837 [Mycena polygramma]|nr:hypothetical protein DFH06DRAFT_1321837 [Mycena polygramma]
MSNYLWQYLVRGACTFASVPQVPGILILSPTEHISDADDSVRPHDLDANRADGQRRTLSSAISPVSGGAPYHDVGRHTAALLAHLLGHVGPELLILSPTEPMCIRCFLHAQDADAR